MRLVLFILVGWFAVGCVSHKKVTLLNDLQESANGSFQTPEPPVVRFAANDLVEINISSASPETDMYFQREGSQLDKKYGGSVYRVSDGGEINLPLVGNLNIAGLTASETENLLTDTLKTYLQRPVVSVRLVSFKITLLGEVARPGVYDVPEARVNILEALGYAGDLTIYGRRDNILLIREESGEKQYHRLNLNNSDVFNSPYFYLQNSDVLYIEPSKGRTSTDDNAYRIVPLMVSSITLVVVLIGLAQ